MRLGLAFINAGAQRKAIRAGGGECFSENSSASGRSPTGAEFHTFQQPPEHGPAGPQSRLCPRLRAGMFHVASGWWRCLVAPSHRHLPVGGDTTRSSRTARGDAQARCGNLCTGQLGFMGKCHISHSFPSPLCCKPFSHLRRRERRAPHHLRPALASHSLCLCQHSRCRRGTPWGRVVPAHPGGHIGLGTRGPQGSAGHGVWVAQRDAAPLFPGPPRPYVGCGVHPSAVTPELPRGGAPEVARGRRERGEADRLKITELAGAGRAGSETAPSRFFTGETAAVG